MKFNLSDLNPGTTFDVGDGASITLRLCNGAALDEIYRSTSTRREVWKRGNRTVETEVDEARRSEMIWDYSIVEWSGIEDEEGKPIPCTADNKATLMNGSLVFSRMVNGLLDQLIEQADEAARALEKN